MRKEIAIFTVAIGENDFFTYTLSSFEKYANKIGADLFVTKQPYIEFRNIFFEKFRIIELLKIYKRVLYLDADILITPNADNIFNQYSDSNCFYAYNENANTISMDRDKYVLPILDLVDYWQKIDGKYQYFNAGVMLFSDSQINALLDYKKESENENMLLWDCDQTLFNYLIVKHKIKFQPISYMYNRMNLGLLDEKESRLNANFIHYAGADLENNGNKFLTIKKDYNKLYFI